MLTFNPTRFTNIKGYSIEGFFNEVGVSMSGVNNYEAELLLELDNIVSQIKPQ